MITILGVTGHWWLWLIGFVGGAVLAVAGGRELLRRIAAPRYQWCDDCAVWCHEVNDPCECCELELDDDEPNRADEAVRRFWRRRLAPVLEPELVDDGQAGEPEQIGEYDDGEPVTGELRAVDDNPRGNGYPLYDPDEQWTLELAELNRARRAGELDELERVPTPIFVALSDDPDLIAWDLRQQAARTWEIAHVEFPKLRAQIARDYAAAARPRPWPATSWEMAA